MCTISELTDQDCPAWDAYIRRAPQGLPHHLAGWRGVLYKTYGYDTPYLVAREGERVVGVMPLFLLRSVLMGNTAATMPGGLCADSEQVAAQLIARGVEIARQANAKRLLVHDTRQAWPGDLHTTSGHVHWMVDVRGGVDAVWKGLHSNIRRQVRIGRRNQLEVQLDRSGGQLEACHQVLSRFTHQMGTPLFGKDFLEHIIQAFPNGFNIAVVYNKEQPIGAYFQLEMGHTVYGMWGAALREYLELRPVYLAYWEMLRDASEHGYHFLDMGRSPAGSEASRYKGQWGGLSRPVYQQVASVGKTQGEEGIATRVQADGKFHLLMRLWPKLPLPLAEYLGPKLRRHVPFA